MRQLLLLSSIIITGLAACNGSSYDTSTTLSGYYELRNTIADTLYSDFDANAVPHDTLYIIPQDSSTYISYQGGTYKLMWHHMSADALTPDNSPTYYISVFDAGSNQLGTGTMDVARYMSNGSWVLQEQSLWLTAGSKPPFDGTTRTWINL